MADADGQIPKILVVEDSPAVTKALAGLLREQGYEPVVFHSGTPALDYAMHQPFDAALIDIHLPDISGLDLTQQLRQHVGEQIPIIILSGDTSMETLRSLPQTGATYFFSKPVNAATLLVQLKAWVA